MFLHTHLSLAILPVSTAMCAAAPIVSRMCVSMKINSWAGVRLVARIATYLTLLLRVLKSATKRDAEQCCVVSPAKGETVSHTNGQNVLRIKDIGTICSNKDLT